MIKKVDTLSVDLSKVGPEKSDSELNKVHEQYLNLQQHFGGQSKDGANSETNNLTPYEICLHQLISVLNWSGDERHFMESLPHFESVNDLAVLQMVLSNIGFSSQRKKISFLKRSNNGFPFVLDFDDGPIIITQAIGSGKFKGLDKDGEREFAWKEIRHANTLLLIQSNHELLGDVEEKKGSWFLGALFQLRHLIYGALFLTFIANILTIGTPIYTMNVYNRVIGGQALDTLAYLFAGICCIILFEVYFRRKRGEILSFIGARIDAEITNRVFKQILTLPVVMTETASINRQIVQFRQFEAIRDLLTGNLASTLLDLPFLFLFFGVIAYLSSWLVVVPFVLLFVFGVIASLTLPTSRRLGRKSGHDRSQFNRMSMELANKMQAIRELGIENLWEARHSRIAQISAFSMFRARFFETSLQSGAQVLVMFSGLATISIGAYQVIDGVIDTGALIAIMMIVWRILTPIQVAFLSLNRIGQLKQTVKQLDRLMSMQGEQRFKRGPNSLRKFKGRIKFENVSFRYQPNTEPVLKGIDLEVEHGELVALTGATGAGKSTILKILLGLYKPQAGRVFLDGINIQQLNVGDIRSSIGFMPQEISLFYGSLSQNLLFANPLACEQEMNEALSLAGVDRDDPLLIGGLDRALRYEKGDLLENDMARIALARAYLANGPILLLDNPGAHFDNLTDKKFISEIQKVKGKKTIFLVTNRPSHIKVCDRILQFHNGMLVNDGSVEEYMKSLEVQAMPG